VISRVKQEQRPNQIRTERGQKEVLEFAQGLSGGGEDELTGESIGGEKKVERQEYKRALSGGKTFRLS